LIGIDAAAFIKFSEANADHEPELFVSLINAGEAFQLAVELGSEMVSVVTKQPHSQSGGIKDPYVNTWWITSVI